HLARGAGLRGLVGMAESSRLVVDGQPIRVFRPLLAVGRANTTAYCAAFALQPRDDPTNRELIYARNRVRHAVVPPLRELNPRFDDALERLGRSARAAEEFVEGELDRILVDLLVEQTASRWVVKRKAFRELPEALQRALIRRAADDLGATVGAEGIEAAMAAGVSWPAGNRIAWPVGIEVRVEHDSFCIGREPTRYPVVENAMPTLLPVADGEAVLRLPPSVGGGERTGEAVLRLRRRTRSCSRPGHRWHADFDARRLGGPLGVRGRRPGDRLAVEGSVGTKKLQDILVDAHIPRGERDRVPLLTTGDAVAWVVGLRRNRQFLADPACRDVLCCEVVDKADDTGVEIC
ncbi:MAG TPA: tRNA lysidine(34) synthetase TilS, partial [Chloroflexota bacterium]|nr:tRNA lysidine(34) synthetase TilS [Chloroflexota bacterium]